MMRVKQVYDLSHRITPEMYHPDGSPCFESYETYEREGCRSSRISTTLHLGTHMDGPWHFVKDGIPIGEVAPSNLVAPGLIVDLSARYSPEQGKNKAISAEDLEAAVRATGRSLDAGDMILISTGWHKLFTTEPKRYYTEFSTLSGEAGAWLAGKAVVLVGIDCCDVDEKRFFAKTPYVPPNHTRNLLPNGISIIENVGGDVDKVLGKKLLIVAAPLRIVGVHGNASPIRLLAVELA